MKQLTLSSMMGKEMSMNASFTVEIYKRKDINVTAAYALFSLSQKMLEGKVEEAISSEALHLVLSTFDDTLRL